jgi:hypothetical protein
MMILGLAYPESGTGCKVRIKRFFNCKVDRAGKTTELFQLYFLSRFSLENLISCVHVCAFPYTFYSVCMSKV